MAMVPSSTHTWPTISSPDASSTGRMRYMEPPVLVLATAAVANKLAATMLLMSAMERDASGIQFWWKALLGEAGEVLEPAVVKGLSDPENRRNGVLHLAAALGFDDVCHQLIKHENHDVNADICGGTPLMFAIEGMNCQIVVKMLLKHGADSNKAGRKGKTPLHIVTANGNAKMLELLLQGAAGMNVTELNNLLSVAASKGHSECVNVLVNAGANANIPDETYVCLQHEVEPDNAQQSLPERKSKSTTTTNTQLYSTNSPGILGTMSSQHIYNRSYRQPSDSTLHMAEENDKKMKNLSKANKSQMADTVKKDNEDENVLAEDTVKTDKKDEKMLKAKMAFFFAHMDKLPSLLLGASLMGIGAAHVAPSIINANGFWFQIFCAGAPVLVQSSVTLFAYTAYYKEKECIDDLGFKTCSFFVLVSHLFLLALLCTIVIAVEDAKAWAVLGPAFFTALLIILTWQLPVREPKSVYTWLMDLWRQRRERLRDNTTLPVVGPKAE